MKVKSSINLPRVSVYLGVTMLALLALLGIAIVTNPYGGGPKAALGRFIPASDAKLLFTDYSYGGSNATVRCTSGIVDYVEGERVIVTAQNGAVMGTFPLVYTAGMKTAESGWPEGFCQYRADITGLPSGQPIYQFYLEPNPNLLISCTRTQLQDVSISFTLTSYFVACNDGEHLTQDQVMEPPVPK